LPQCVASAGQSGAVAWFKVVGTGGTLRASSCNSDIAHDFTLYSGSCGNLTCVDEVQIGFNPYEGYGGFGSSPPCNVTASWSTTEDVEYFMLLQGTGIYRIKVEEASAFPVQ
jgi:hypothetical protein